MSELVSLDQIKDLIRTEKLKPSDLFDAADLKPLVDEGMTRGYAEARSAALRDQFEAAATKPQPKTDGGEDPDAKYIDPQQNPFIRKA